MKVLAASLGDHRDRATGVAAVLGRVVRQHYLDFGNRIHGWHLVHAPVRSGIKIRHAVDGHVLGIVAAARQIQVSNGGRGGSLAAVCCVHDARHKAYGVHHIAAAQ